MTTLNDFTVTDDVTDVLAAHVTVLQANALRAEFSNTETISATKELADVDTRLQILTPSGADRDVELPPEAISNHAFTIINPSASSYSLIVKDDSGTITYAVLAPGANAEFVSDGTTWRVLGNVSNGWTPSLLAWSYATSSTFTIAGDVTAIYRKGTKLKWTQATGGQKYGVVAAASYSSPNTTITIIVNTDYVLTNKAITAPYYSHIENPEGFPGSFNWTPTISSSAGTVTNPTITTAKYWVVGAALHFLFDVGFDLTGATALNIYATLPVTPAMTNVPAVASCRDASSGAVPLGFGRIFSAYGGACSLPSGDWSIGVTKVARLQGEYVF